MRNITYFLFLITFLLSATSCKNNTDNKKPIENSIDKKIENWLTITGIPSTSIVFFMDGKIIKSQAYGYSNLKTETLASTSTIYNTGSNFKSVTATAIMQLQEKGLIDIDKPINNYLKEPIEYFDTSTPITAKHLMSHQSGIPTSVGMKKVWGRKSNRTLENIASTIKPNSKPEKKFQYCNDGYAILGLLIENVTGLTYEEYIWKNILVPLGIETHGFLNPTPEMIENLALPYHIRYNKAYPTNQVHLEQYPAGDIFLKPSDMVKFLMMQLNNGVLSNKRILKKESVQRMHRPHIRIQENAEYGLGFGIDEINGKKYSQHQGSLPGYLSAFMMDFETKSGVYIATNVSATPQQERQIQYFINYLFEHVKNDKLSTDLQIPVDKNTATTIPSNMKLENYVGKYKIVNTPVHLTIDKIGKQLFLINPAKERFRIEYLNPKKFFITTENEDIEFEEIDGSIQGLKLFSGGNEINAKKE